MDARWSTAAVCLCGLLATAGCPLQSTEPAARPEKPQTPPPTEDAEVVATEADDLQPVADVESNLQQVQRWIERIQRRDDLRSRVTLPPDGATFAPATQSAASQPAAPANAEPEPNAADPQEKEPPPPPAPVLGDVGVRAGEERTPTASPNDDSPPAVNAPATAANQSLTLEEFVEQWLAQPTETSFRNQLDRRVLLVLAGKYEEARQPLELVSNQQQQMAAHFIETLIAIREGHGGEPAAEANRVLEQFEQLAEALLPLSELRIPRLALTRAVQGYGRYQTFDPPHFLTGREHEFVVYCEVANFLSRLSEDGAYESHFSMRTAVLNRAGDVVLEINDRHIADRCRTRRRDCFIPRLVRLPATLSPGEYVVKVTIVDKIGEKVVEKRTTFRILARS